MTDTTTPTDAAGTWPAVTARLARVQAIADDIDRAAATGSPQRAQEPEQLARLFHDTYETLAPEFGYRTREASAKPWADVPEKNRALMVATCARVLDALSAQAPSVDRPSVAGDSPPAPGEGDGQDTTPPDAQRAAEAAVAAREAAVRAVLDTMGWADDRDDPGGEGVPPAPCWTLAGDIVNAVYPSIAADALRRYADRHHAHPGGPTNLIQTLTIREAGGAIYDYDACRSCSARLDEHGQCTGERPRLLLAAQRIAAGEPDPADPPRPGTEWQPEQADRG